MNQISMKLTLIILFINPKVMEILALEIFTKCQQHSDTNLASIKTNFKLNIKF